MNASISKKKHERHKQSLKNVDDKCWIVVESGR